MQTAARKLTAFRSYRVATGEIFDPAEHALDCVSVAIEDRRKAGFFLRRFDLGRDIGHRAVLLGSARGGVAVVALVAIDHVASGKRLLQRDGPAVQSATLPPVIRNASGRQCSSVARKSWWFGPRGNGRWPNFLPPFPPVAERWAFTAGGFRSSVARPGHACPELRLPLGRCAAGIRTIVWCSSDPRSDERDVTAEDLLSAPNVLQV